MIIDTRTYGNVTRSFNRADWTEADIDFYIQHILPQEVEAEQQAWDETHYSLTVHSTGEDCDAALEFARLHPRPQLAEDHPLPDSDSYAMSLYEEAMEPHFG